MDGGGTSHPNLSLMKLSAWHKSRGDNVSLCRNTQQIRNGDIVKISKVFTWSKDPELPLYIHKQCKVEVGGTGYYYDKAPRLPYEIEHMMPDYHLYDEYVRERVEKKGKKAHPENYTQFSIGFITRGCFRKCSFCVNKNYDKAVLHSPLEEFHDESRPYIRLWDDNILSCKDWEHAINQLDATGKKCIFQQGLDMRLMTEHKADRLTALNYYDNRYLFAFDQWSEHEQLAKKIPIWIKYMQVNTRIRAFYGRYYVLVGYKSLEFDDVLEMFQRIHFLMQHASLPMIMFFNGTQHINTSPYAKLYKFVQNWVNPIAFPKQSLLQYVEKYRNKHLYYLQELIKLHPELIKYFNMRFCDERQY